MEGCHPVDRKFSDALMSHKLFQIAVILFCLNASSSNEYPGNVMDLKCISAPNGTFPERDLVVHPPCTEDDIPHYTAYKVTSAPKIDGKLDEAIWEEAPRSSRFRDLITGAETIHDTRAAVLWDDTHLYVAYWVEEPDLRATLTKRDAPVYKDNDVEFFISGEDAYYEFEINAFGTVYEVLFIWEEAFVSGGYDTIAEFNRNHRKSRAFNGVGYTSHPRGLRIGYWDWDLPGLQSAVYLDGTINNGKDRDRGWTVELAIPWSGMTVLARGDGRSLPPKDRDVWRMDFSRFNQYKEAPPAKDSGGWAWSPHGVWDSHVPECFTYIHFSGKDMKSKM
ncbi:MAG: carbohydrate-binding family 9-like protein [Cytophagales bacterium]|nr:carbohydrate-binding family 9-like protein [Cytophagales bacterium]